MADNDEQQGEGKDLEEPAHHARRPMNAFLIFCKRHRGSVRSGFPQLENRAVTRVLGEWWATLDPEQKRSYINLAQEYKDAFLNANPDFKWYKLPAPPLRTLNTRPTNKKSDTIGISNYPPNDLQDDDQDDEDSTLIDRDDDRTIQPGKLADESQIGGLSSLFTPKKVHSSNTDLTEIDDTIPESPKKKCINTIPVQQNKKDCKVDLFGVKNESNNNDEEHESIEKYERTTTAEITPFRNNRTCKGLRYQKFLAEQSVTQQSKKKRISTPELSNERRRNSISSNVSEKTDSLSSEGNSSRSELEHLVESAEGNIEASKPEGTENQLDYGPWAPRKRFKAEDFNLEKKIQALPSLSLEEFQEKKKQQRTEKKKHLQTNKRNRDIDQRVLDNDKSNLLVGSQKRKARKQSITRKTSLLPKQSNDAWCSSPDLEALACLAAVAANRTKLTKDS